ncbi:MAG: TrmH family RNA methyltransferase [Patescibacteria group bacterium]|nr:TrmH family RNA methyltransferase [bacterium]MDZ4240981.1 TrmH family RNA methyltransferase [Patescibacteria group bacterium]
MSSTSGPVSLILNDIRSVYNVGSIFRTADAAGVSKIFLTGYTPTPVDRFGRSRKDFAKVSLGSEKSVEWESCADIESLLVSLKKQGVTIIALEQTHNALDYRTIQPHYPLALVYGNETEGVPSGILKHCDMSAYIPMRGEKESLNVSVAVGISLFKFTEGDSLD